MWEGNPNSSIHGAWFAIGMSEKSCCRATWRLILETKRDLISFDEEAT